MPQGTPPFPIAVRKLYVLILIDLLCIQTDSSNSMTIRRLKKKPAMLLRNTPSLFNRFEHRTGRAGTRGNSGMELGIVTRSRQC